MTYRFTTKREFEADFRESVLPAIRAMEDNRGIDYVLRREEWNNSIDALVKDGDLPPKAMDWICPW